MGEKRAFIEDRNQSYFSFILVFFCVCIKFDVAIHPSRHRIVNTIRRLHAHFYNFSFSLFDQFQDRKSFVQPIVGL